MALSVISRPPINALRKARSRLLLSIVYPDDRDVRIVATVDLAKARKLESRIGRRGWVWETVR
jgi:hypothetical protein